MLDVHCGYKLVDQTDVVSDYAGETVLGKPASSAKRADAGDEALYNKLKDQVAAAKASLRLAELHAEDALAAYNKAAAMAPGMEPMAPGPSAHDSILRSDVAEAQKAIESIKTELLDLLAQMKRAAESGDKTAYDALKKKGDALKTKLALSERRLVRPEPVHLAAHGF